MNAGKRGPGGMGEGWKRFDDELAICGRANKPLGFSWRSGMPYRKFGSHAKGHDERVAGRLWEAGPSQALSLLGRRVGNGRPGYL